MASEIGGESPASRRQIRQRLSRWLHRAVPGQNSRTPPPPKPLPWPRPRPITPSESVPGHPQNQSAFFARLPLEIRRDILLLAFGNSTMHMDLSFDHPMVKIEDTDFHCGFSRNRDTSLPKRWIWRSCICHRNTPLPPGPHKWWSYWWFRPDEDSCMAGYGRNCNSTWWIGEWPAMCRVGVMGWLLSCRAAYNECIHLLYETNKFHLSGETLLTHLPDYILPARLTQMSSFEAALSLTGSINVTPFRPSYDTYVSLLSMLSKHTAIQHLHLSLCYPQVSTRTGAVDLSPVFDAMDAFVRASEPKSVVIHMDVDVLKDLHIKNTDIDRDYTEAWRDQYRYQIWRCLDGDVTKPKIHRRMCLYPRILAPLQDPALPELGRSRGYWIMEIPHEPMYACMMGHNGT